MPAKIIFDDAQYQAIHLRLNNIVIRLY